MEIKVRPNHLVHICGGALHLPLLLYFTGLKYYIDSIIISLTIFSMLMISVFITNESKIFIENPIEKANRIYSGDFSFYKERFKKENINNYLILFAFSSSMFIPVSMGYHASRIMPFLPKIHSMNISLFTLSFFSFNFFLTCILFPMLIKNREATVQEDQVVSVTKGEKRAVKIGNIKNLRCERYILNVECSDGSEYKFWHSEPQRLSDEILVNKI